MTDRKVLLSACTERCREPIRIEHFITQKHNKKSTWLSYNQTTYYLYVLILVQIQNHCHKRNSCRPIKMQKFQRADTRVSSMKNTSVRDLKKETINVLREKAWRDYMIDWYLNKLDLTCDRKPLPIIDLNPTGLNHVNLKVVRYVFLPVKIEEVVHSMEATKMNE